MNALVPCANQIFNASEIYLRSKLALLNHSSSIQKVKVAKTPRDKNLSLGFENDHEIIDFFRGIQLKWKFLYNQGKNLNPDRSGRSFELIFDKKYKGIVLDSYLPHVVEESKSLTEENKVMKLHNLGRFYGRETTTGPWGSINLEHPATFDKLAMEPDLKRALIEDLDKFVKRRNFYTSVGKAWKRGYLLYGPPGTGKSSLIAAMANYLKFDIYDLELTGINSNSDLRELLLKTSNRSILVIEDIDCTIELENRQRPSERVELTLSGLLNNIDGLWSSCGDDRIVVFTTNYKDRLDPALLRPGRMDMHVHLSYCTPSIFRQLVSIYRKISDHPLFEEIERLIEKVKVTPAEVAEEMMRSDDVDINLHGLIDFIHRKKKIMEQIKSIHMKKSMMIQKELMTLKMKHKTEKISEGVSSRSELKTDPL
ncbi:AAA-ATPase At3g50940-like [Telopea speciosissima]|uniref:AAA-ATPase At3g50940-like n=1 Tax=Telopea speciosissima TaxID=54955 RepID=UPI001CC76F84|nr:AAA-ATPase At3g50940-like [Telopea speciosissima]